MFEVPRIGALDPGGLNSIADVAGVTVDHLTLADRSVQTGVTVVRPHPGDLYREPLPAAAVVLNGFAKTIGLVQLDELGALESPIALTNTFAAGTIATTMIRHAVAANPSIGRTSPTLNPVVAECNDGWLAFSTAERFVRGPGGVHARRTMRDEALDGLFDAAAEATEQAIVNALFAAETVAGYAGHVRYAITEQVPAWKARLEQAESRCRS